MMIPPSQTASSPDEVVPPKVNPRFQRIRDENFQRKVAEGYSPSQAMSVSAGTEREEDDIDPLRSSGVQTTEGGRSKYAVLTEHIHQPQAAFMGSTIQGGPNALRDRSPSEERRAKLQRDQMPSNVIPQGRAAVPRPQQRSRWLTSPDEILSAAEDVHRSLHPTVLQIQAPRGVVTAARSLTEDGTSTQASTLISEDPWREEAHDNRRLGR
ncbi:MAG: hypothetical protein M1833_000740 [Piccolia ochrophora]|nr:MAG: hypothetical protein M1833_000740 [Piccolia ochrophora]